MIKMMQGIRLREQNQVEITVFYFDDISSMKDSTIMNQIKEWEKQQ